MKWGESERERRNERGGGRQEEGAAAGANEAPLFDISYSTFSAVAAEEEMN